MGIPEYEAKRYESQLKSGGILLSVHCDTSDEIKRSKELLKGTGAEDTASTGENSHGVEPARVRARRECGGESGGGIEAGESDYGLPCSAKGQALEHSCYKARRRDPLHRNSACST